MSIGERGRVFAADGGVIGPNAFFLQVKGERYSGPDL